jgi:hypothetical protein
MPEGQTLFYVVLVSQILLLSLYLPGKVLRRVRYVTETYPPSSYPRLYPVTADVRERAERNYRNLNRFALLIGFGLVFIGIYSPSEEMLHWDSISVLTIYMALQYSPLIIAATSGFTYFNVKRKMDRRTTRKAELHPRRLFDFISPTVVAIALVVYVAFVGLIVYVSQFDFPWFGGYWNIVGITVLYLFLAGTIVQILYGKKKDPYQTHDDRIRQIDLNVKLMVYSSIIGTLFVGIAIGLHAFDFEALIPVALSLYCQILALLSFRTLRIDNVNFEVYKEDPVVA